VHLRAHDLAFLTDGGVAWPAGELSVAWRQAQNLREPWTNAAPVTAGEVAGERLKLDALARIAESAPLGEPLRVLLAGLAPSGTLDSLQARWAGPVDQPASYQVDARLSDLSLRSADPAAGAGPGRPGLRNAALQLSANEHGGQARLAMRNGALVFPGLWEQPELPVDALQAALSWRILATPGRPSTFELKLADARLSNADLQGDIDAQWHSGAGDGRGRGGRFPGTLDLNATLTRARAESVARYLPLGISQATRHHVRDAVQGGSITSASFKVKGDLADFPFHSVRQGELRIALQVRDLVYAFVPSHPADGERPAFVSPWPALQQVSGEIEFDRLTMNLRHLRGRIWGYELQDVQGGIADLAAPHKLLTLRGQGRGPAADLLRFARLAPLGPRGGAALEAIAVNGPSELRLDAGIALDAAAPTTLRGSLQLAGNELRLQPDLPPLQAARGTLDFSPQGLVLRSLSARLLGGDTTLDGSLGADGTLRLNGQGSVTAEALRSTPQPAWLGRLGQVLRGQAAWRGTLAWAEGQPELLLQSNLVGMQIELPAPLAKPVAATPLPLRLQLSAPPGPGAKARDNLQFELGDLLKAQFQRELSDAEPRVQRGSVAVRDTLPPLPASGVQAALNLGRVDVDAWLALLERQGAAGEPGAAGYLPQSVRLRAEELRSGSRFLSQVDATLTRQGTGAETWWQAGVTAEQLAGDIEYRPAASATAPGRVTARLQRVALPASQVSAVEGLLDQPLASVPALDIVVDDFQLRGRSLGRLQLLAVNRLATGRGGQREWQLDKLDLDMPEAQLRGSGRWAAGGSRRMALDFKLALQDSGAFLERLGAGQALRGGKGTLQGQLSWAGSPLALDYPSLEGKLRLDVAQGQFLHADPGSARLLGVLSLQSLPRRLSLDFRDLFQQGFAFDSIEGDVSVARGVAETADLRMRGAQATVLMQGSADLLHETQDLGVLVVPNFDATGAALATMVINPVLGVGTLFAQWALREPLIAAGTSEFRITGSWADPRVQQLQRRGDAPAAAPGPAPAAAPASAPPRGAVHSTERPPG
jgi:uncharacterized protein (TIGR02099 family)